MTADETKLRSLIEGSQQYLVAFIQRPCSWGKSQWKSLWDDVQAQARELNDRGHYVGMVVTMPAPSGLESIGM